MIVRFPWGGIAIFLQRAGYGDCEGAALAITCVRDHGFRAGSGEWVHALRYRSLTAYSPELGLSILGLAIGGLMGGGAIRYALFGLAWLLALATFFEILPALLALMISAAAVAGLFGIVDFESFLALIALMVFGSLGLTGVAVLLLACASAARYLLHRVPRPRIGTRGGRIQISGRPRSRVVRDEPTRRPSLSQYIVTLAVSRISSGISAEECERWEEEMRADVETTFVLLRVFYALTILLRGAPAMSEDLEVMPTRPER
jgi:hypothetical protein